jgi:uncharacterized membrane protein (DUF373 family)
MEKFTNGFIRGLHWATVAIEVLVALGLVVLAGVALLTLGSELLHITTNQLSLTTAEFNLVIGTVLEIFILVELFRIAVAYMRHEHVVPTVLEAALVAVARKFVVLEPGLNFIQTALALSALLLAVALSWFALAKSGAFREQTEEIAELPT